MTEEEQVKNVFLQKIREITCTRGLALKKDKNWERFEYGITISVNEHDDIPQLELMVRQHVNDVLIDWSWEKSYDIEAIKWHESEGQSGPFQRSVDRENPMFQKLAEELMTKRSMVINGWYVWLFEDNKTLGRKPSGK